MPLINRIKQAGKTVVVCAVEGHTNKAMITESHFAFYVNLKEIKKEKAVAEIKIPVVNKSIKNKVDSIYQKEIVSLSSEKTNIKSLEKLTLNNIKEKIESIITLKKDKAQGNKLDLTFVSGTFGNRHPGLKYREYGCSKFMSLMTLLKYKTEMDSDNKVYILL